LHDGEVQVKGNIVGISEPYKVISEITGECYCGEKTTTFDPPFFTMPKDVVTCKDCNKDIYIDKHKTGYQNAITVQIQDNEKFNDIEKVTCILLDTDIDKISIGEKVIITGTIYILPKFNKNFLGPMVFSDKLEYENADEIIINEKDIEAIKRFANLKGPSIIEALVDMLDKSIIGNDEVKESLLYCLVSAGDDLADIRKSKSRNRINVLLAGNPGLGKSSLLKKAISLIKNSRYESVQHSTAKSLTAIVLKEDEQYFLRLGPVPISKGSICALNELGTLSIDDQNHLLDIMEEGEFTINKHGFSSKIQAPTTIIASANLKKISSDIDFEAFNKTPLSDIPLEKQLLDRFDLIVILKDEKDCQALIDYTEKKTDLQSNSIPVYDIFIQKYLEYARKLKPILSPEAKKMIQEYYINLHKSNPALESKRVLETIFRLCKATSKLKLKEIADAEDVVDATRFNNGLIDKYLNSKALVPKDPVKMTIEKCIDILKDNEEKQITYTELLGQVCDDSEYIKSYLLGSNLKKTEDKHKLLSSDKNKKVRKILERLRNQENIKIVNKNPVKFQFIDTSILQRSERSDESEKILIKNTSIDSVSK
jgi:replicative DNA helicase Mcm